MQKIKEKRKWNSISVFSGIWNKSIGWWLNPRIERVQKKRRLKGHFLITRRKWKWMLTEEGDERGRARSQDELSSLINWWRPEKRRAEEVFFLLFCLSSLTPLCLSLWVESGRRLVRPDPGGELSSAGTNLCDRSLLDESDHPCWLTQWMEPVLTEWWLRGKSLCREGRRRDGDLALRNYSLTEGGERDGGIEGRDLYLFALTWR